MDPNDEGIDEQGNTTLHQMTQDLFLLETQIDSMPHLLFMLNKHGLTPLDVAINEKEEDKAKLLIAKMSKFTD